MTLRADFFDALEDAAGRVIKVNDHIKKIRDVYPGGPKWATTGTVMDLGKRLIVVRYDGHEYEGQPHHRISPADVELIRTAAGVELTRESVRSYAEVYRDNQNWWTLIVYDPRAPEYPPAQIRLEQSTPEMAEADMSKELDIASRHITRLGWSLDGSWEIQSEKGAVVSTVSMTPLLDEEPEDDSSQ